MKCLIRTGRPELAFVTVLAATLLAASCASAPQEDTKPDAVSGVSFVAEANALSPEELVLIPDSSRVLVVYFTTGNAAERVAEDLAALYSADVERITEKKPRNWGFMNGGFAATMGQATPILEPSRDPSGYDRVFVLTPVWSWNMAPPVRSWLRWARGRLPEVAYGTISGDTEPEKIVARMAKEGGRNPFAYAGFSERDFLPENRGIYVDKLAYLVGAKQRVTR